MFAVRVRADVRRLGRDLTRVQKRIVPKVAAQALNRTARGVKTESVRAVAQSKAVKNKLIRGRITIPKKANERKLKTHLRVRGHAIPLIVPGAAAEVKKGARAGRRYVEGGFIAAGKKGKQNIFKRLGRESMPIARQTIPVVPEIFTTTKDKVKRVGTERFRREFLRLLSVRLRKKARR